MSQESPVSSESLLKESEERYRALFDNASDMIQSVRPDGTFEFVNRAWHDALGYGEDDLPGLIIWDIIYPTSVGECEVHFGQAMMGASLVDIRATFMKKNGDPIPAEGSVQSRFVGDEIVATHSFFRDISERLRSEELEVRNAQLEREQQARFLEKMAALGKLSAGLSHELNNPSAAAQRSAQRLSGGLEKRDIATRELIDAGVGTDGWLQLERLVTQCTDGRSSPGQKSPLEVSALEDTIQDWLQDHGIAEYWTHSVALVQGGITIDALDDLSRRLPAAIAPAIAWIGETLALSEQADVIARSTDRISELVAAVKAYSFRDQATEQDVDIHDGLENTLVILAYRLKSMTIERHFDRQIPPVRTYGSGLNQVWTNILDNAVDATDGEGAITIRTYRDGRMAVVEMSDDGPGISADHASRIFEPFYTTKPQGLGTGLGLDIAWRIVTDEHGGQITVDSRPGTTTFRVAIPICPDLLVED